MTTIDTRVATPTAPTPRRAAVGHVTQWRAVVSEWVKFRTLRSTWITLAFAVAGTIGIGALASWGIASHWAHLSPAEQLTFSPISQSLTGVYLAQLAIGVLGVLVISGEYATGMIRATLAAVPTRVPVLWAKLTVFASTTFVFTLAASVASFFIGQQLLGVHGTTISAPHAVQAVIGVALYLTVVGILSLAIGSVVRSTAGGIATVFGLLLVLPVIGHVLPQSWQTSVLPYLPSNAGGALFKFPPDSGTLGPWTGFGVMCAWAAAAVIAAVVLLRRRDA
jgi:ABC-2 type transport system permease protein